MATDLSAEVLSAAVARYVQRGYRIESQTARQAIVVYGKRVNHILHLILSVLTLGLWLVVWLLMAIGAATQRDRRILSLDANGILVDVKARGASGSVKS